MLLILFRSRLCADAGPGYQDMAAEMRGWREHERHRLAQRLGREQWYSEYHIEVAEIARDRDWAKH